ncbi:CocE/NonD family hydrolase [Hyphococcus sp.]|uniref:CocE/NonD family hydrolase n=1 Tax=Hyphococcus sp. TaxID=2038636 RepID=UPI0035C775FA
MQFRMTLFVAACAFFAGIGAHAARSDEPYEDVIRTSAYVAVRDGTKLAVNVYRPAIDGVAVDEKLPVIFSATPYRARYRDESGEIVDMALSDRHGMRSHIAHGYVVVTADIRGKGASFGARRGFQDRTEAMDHYDLIEWAAEQPWSDGNVGMTGCSYLGGATMQAATVAPPHLKAVFVGASDYDKYTFVRRGGIPAQFNTRPDEPLSVDLASVPVDADKDGSQRDAAVAEHAGNTPMAALWYGMPYRDSISEFTGTKFWEEVGPYTYAETLKSSGIAYYFWSTWKDEPAEQVLLAARNLDGRLMMGPGNHCEPPPDMDLGEEARRFFDFHLKGEDTGIESEPRYKWWTLDAPEGEVWKQSDAEPGAGVLRTKLALSQGDSGTVASVNDGLLVAKGARKGEDAFRIDYSVGGKEYFPFWPAVLDEKGLTYTSAPLAEDVAMEGYPVVELVMSADREDAPIFVYLEEVAPDGTAENISFGRLLMSHRKLSEPPYDYAGLPWHSGNKADVSPVRPGKIYDITFALTPSAKIFRAGHRIRVSIRGADPRQRNIDEIAAEPAPELTIYTGAKKSAVAIPFVEPPVFVKQQGDPG